jgi:ubiquinone/menaquinone biosynthesis C-methylase UbiE
LTNQKEKVRDFWNRLPCGTRGNPYPQGTREYFNWVETERYTREPFIERFAEWPRWQGKSVLEMGVGAGSDFVRFTRFSARSVGLDLADTGVRLVKQRLRSERLPENVLVGDVETLPFGDGVFDFVYSWGVIHHTENTGAAVRELLRVLKDGGRFCVMIYHRYSLVCLQAYLIYGLLRGRPWESIDSIARDHLESFGTKVYSEAQARALFANQEVRITHVITPYDLRFGKTRFLPRSCGRVLPKRFGYFMVVEGVKSRPQLDQSVFSFQPSTSGCQSSQLKR